MPTTLKGREVDLELFKFDACPFCRRVQSTLDGLDVPGLKVRDTRAEPEANRELMERGGKVQVPCLFIDGQPLYESSDISAWLTEHFPAK